ncbi:unnamed protein product, partial [Cladocopium goreaui]
AFQRRDGFLLKVRYLLPCHGTYECANAKLPHFNLVVSPTQEAGVQVNWTGKELACALYDGLVVAEPSGLGCFEIGVSRWEAQGTRLWFWTHGEYIDKSSKEEPAFIRAICEAKIAELFASQRRTGWCHDGVLRPLEVSIRKVTQGEAARAFATVSEISGEFTRSSKTFGEFHLQDFGIEAIEPQTYLYLAQDWWNVPGDLQNL